MPDNEPAPPSGGCGLVAAGRTRIRFDLSYDGTDFHGWATQPGLRTVQETLENTLRMVTRASSPVRLSVAGRTDAGVHASAQVAHADTSRQVGDELVALRRRLASALPPDVRVRSVSVAPEGFDARFSASGRAYRYRLCDDVAGADPLRRRDTMWYRRRLDIDAMVEAAAALQGAHDFAAYARPRWVFDAVGARMLSSTVRHLDRLDVVRGADGVIRVDAAADAFCHHQVRFMVGALIAVGEGRRPPPWPGEVLVSRRRPPSLPLAPARGLTLVSVLYPEPEELRTRAEATRTLRPWLGAHPPKGSHE